MTRDNTWWGEGVTNQVRRCKDPYLCSSTVIHAYRNIDLAYLFCWQHGWGYNVDKVLWECEGRVVVESFDKVGCFKLTTIKQLIPPDWCSNKNSYLKTIIWFYLILLREAFKFIPSSTEYYHDALQAYELVCNNLNNSNFDFHALHYMIVKNVLYNYDLKANMDRGLVLIFSLIRDVIHIRYKNTLCMDIDQSLIYYYKFPHDKLVSIIEEAKER
jgi:hypothetical protein